MSNKYIEKFNQDRNSKSLPVGHGPGEELGEASAYDILKMMRPEVEQILTTAGFCSPPSQSYRALACMDHLRKLSHSIHNRRKKGEQIEIKSWSALCKAIRSLEDFLAVHRTVWILEGNPL